VFIALLLVTGACKKSDKEENLAAEVKVDVSYGVNAKNTMDVYLPANRGSATKTIILVHGGFWMGGDKNDFTEYAKLLQGSGFAVVNMNYRLTGTAENIRVGDQQNDIKAAVSFVSQNAADWNVGSDKFAMMGASAGAHLALLYTYANNIDSKVKTVISVAGPANLTDTRNVNLQFAGVVQALVGANPLVNPQAFADASPYYKAGASSKSTLIVHGRNDAVVPVHQAQDLKLKLDGFQVKNELIIYEGVGHDDVINPSNLVSFMTKVTAWINENVN